MSTGSRLAMSAGMAWTSAFGAARTGPAPIAEASAASPNRRAMIRRCRSMVGSSRLIRMNDDGTGDGMAVADIDQRRLLRRAGGLRQRASSDQTAGVRRIDRA